MSTMGLNSVKSERDIKNMLFQNAKLRAMNEIFGEYISSMTQVVNSKIVNDKITLCSVGQIKTKVIQFLKM